MINQKDRNFIDKRKKLHRYWPIMGTTMILMMLGLVIYLFIRTPKLINPFLVIELIKANTLDPRTMILLAAMCPVLTIFLLVTVAVVIIYVWAFMVLEGRYHKILDDIDKPEQTEEKIPQKEKPQTEEKAPEDKTPNESQEEKS